MTGSLTPDPIRREHGAGIKAEVATSGPAPTSGRAATSRDAPISGRAAAAEPSSVEGQGDPLVADAQRVLTDWPAPSPAQDGLRVRYLAFLDQHPDASSRDLRVGHLTASTVVLDASRERVLLTLHPLAERWFQLGGHVEAGDGSMAAAALREAAEESGIAGLALHPTPIGLDWHEVRCRDRHGVPTPSSHLDFEYVAVAPPGAEHLRSEESLDLAWFPLDELPEGADDVVRALIQRVRDLRLA